MMGDFRGRGMGLGGLVPLIPGPVAGQHVETLPKIREWGIVRNYFFKNYTCQGAPS